MTAAATVDLSVVLPCFNEEGCVEALADEIVASVKPLGLDYEILYVDDGSTDGTVAALLRARSRHPEVRIVRHATNRGQSAAMATGFERARGSVLVVMDSDLQSDPADIPRLIEALRGHDCVATKRLRRQDDWVNRVASRLANAFRNAVTGEDRISDAGCAYRAIRREALRELFVWNGMHRFLPTMLRLQGFRVTEIEVNHRPRTTGRSKYGIRDRLWRGIADCFAMRWYRKRVIPAQRVEPGES